VLMEKEKETLRFRVAVVVVGGGAFAVGGGLAMATATAVAETDFAVSCRGRDEILPTVRSFGVLFKNLSRFLFD